MAVTFAVRAWNDTEEESGILIVTITPILAAVVLESRKRAEQIQKELKISRVKIGLSIPYPQAILIADYSYSLAGNYWRSTPELMRYDQRQIIDEITEMAYDDIVPVIPFECEPVESGRIRADSVDISISDGRYVWFKCLPKNGSGIYYSDGVSVRVFEDVVKQIKQMPQLYSGLDFLNNLSVLK